MPRIIFKCPYLKGGSERAASHLHNYVRYMATREGTQRITPATEQLPATRKQREMVEQLLRDFPLSRGLFEYEDYTTAPTRANASEFITRALEDNYDRLAKRENYVSYIASRPRAQRAGKHALFTGADDPLVLSSIADEVAHHPGNMWLPIISLRREDAARLGYDDAGQWKELLTGYAMEMAEAMKIPWEQFRWYAAFHDESHHPHIHMVCYSADGRSGYLTRDGIARIKSDLAKRIFRQELHELYERQTRRRDKLTREGGAVMAELVRQMREGTLENPKIEQLMEHLAGKLKNLSGKKQYGYLKTPLKSVVDEIVEELAKDERVARAYELWYELREEVLRTYKENLPPRLPLSQQKEFKRIRNMVIEEALRLSDDAAVFDPTAPEELLSERDMPEADQAGEASSEQPEPSMEAEDTSEPEERIDVGEERKSRGRPNTQTARTEQYQEARRFLFGGEGQAPDFDRAFALFQKEAQTGSALAMYDLGRMFEDGLGREKDMEQARAWYAKALHHFLAMEAKKPGRYVEYRIGKLFASGRGTEQDHLSAADWFAKSAEQSYMYAQYSLAGLYARGQGVERDDQKARLLYEKAAEQGFPYAAYELGKMYRDGVGCEADAEQSAEYFKAAFRGFRALEDKSHDDKLQYRIGWMLLRGAGAEKDAAAARSWFEKSAGLGNPHARYQLAKLVLADPTAEPGQIMTALEWLTEAAKAGQVHAQYELGKIYRDGRGVEKDVLWAAAWFAKAAEQDSGPAAYALARLLLTGGEGLAKDVPAAVRWLKRSAEAGNQFAQYRLGKLLLQGEDVPKDIAEALHWLAASAEQGSQYAQYALGKIYLLGKDVPRDQESAARWLTLSAVQSNEYAQYLLDHMNDRPSIFSSATRLLHHLSGIFREQASRGPARTPTLTDRKLRQRIREKKMAMGHRPDDHENAEISMR